MKIFSAAQVREWDAYTVMHEPIAAIDLMERAAGKCVQWLQSQLPEADTYCIICGNGNNGGDGLVMARLLSKAGGEVRVFICHIASRNAADFDTNLTRLVQETGVKVQVIISPDELPIVDKREVIIEALYGSGLLRQPESMGKMLIEYINALQKDVISIDIPGGMYADKSSALNAVVKATNTLSFQTYKLAFLLPENGPYIGKVHVLDIGLHTDYYNNTKAAFLLTTASLVKSIYKPRNPFAHKGSFGHALLLAGSYGKMGAALLSAKACLRSGTGLLTCHIPRCGYAPMQNSLPEAMVSSDENETMLTHRPDLLDRYQAIGVGPGIGTSVQTKEMLRQLFAAHKAVVADADALNCMAADNALLNALPPESILTPHPKEFERLFGIADNDFEVIEKALQYAARHQITIVLKGHHSFIATADGCGYFNNTGNAGMATGGSGDVLTGIITGLLAQDYSCTDAAVLGVHLHGAAGDIAAKKYSQEAMLAGDIVECMGEAFKALT